MLIAVTVYCSHLLMDSVLFVIVDVMFICIIFANKFDFYRCDSFSLLR